MNISKLSVLYERRALPILERMAAELYPRRCPLCGTVLKRTEKHEYSTCLCADCAKAAKQLEHIPPRLPETEHVLANLAGAASAYYYDDAVRGAILMCKEYGNPWYARELADLMAVRIFGAAAAAAPGRRPRYDNPSGIPLYSMVVPVPPRERGGFNMPHIMAKRLSAVLEIPFATPLYTTRKMLPQKTLKSKERMMNTRGAYSAAGSNLEGKRILLVDDIITTGSTISACAQALVMVGAFEVFAASAAVAEEHKHKA